MAKKLNQGIVYWVHLPEHTDVATQGYVGITKCGLEARRARHIIDSSSGSDFHFHRVMRKHADSLVWDVCFEGDYAACAQKEFELRPRKNIGWNMLAGGHDIAGENNPMFGMSGENSPCFGRTGEKHPMFGKKHKRETRNKMSEARKGQKRSEETRKKMSDAQKGEKNHRCKIKDADIARMIELKKQGVTQVMIAQNFGCSTANVSMILNGLSRQNQY